MKKHRPKKHRSLPSSLIELTLQLDAFGTESAASVDKLPPEVEAHYLKRLLDFEEMLERKDEFSIDLDRQIRQRIPLPDTSDALSDLELQRLLHQIIECLCRFHIALDFTDYLDDRSLYEIIVEHVLPAPVLHLPDPRGASIHFPLIPYEVDLDSLQRVADRDDWIQERLHVHLFQSLPVIV